MSVVPENSDVEDGSSSGPCSPPEIAIDAVVATAQAMTRGHYSAEKENCDEDADEELLQGLRKLERFTTELRPRKHVVYTPDSDLEDWEGPKRRNTRNTNHAPSPMKRSSTHDTDQASFPMKRSSTKNTDQVPSPIKRKFAMIKPAPVFNKAVDRRKKEPEPEEPSKHKKAICAKTDQHGRGRIKTSTGALAYEPDMIGFRTASVYRPGGLRAALKGSKLTAKTQTMVCLSRRIRDANAQCKSCRHKKNYNCMFKGFRILLSDEDGAIKAVTFTSDLDCDEEALKPWHAAPLQEYHGPEQAAYVLSYIYEPFHDLATEELDTVEKAHMLKLAASPMYWKRQEDGLRELCDKCSVCFATLYK